MTSREELEKEIMPHLRALAGCKHVTEFACNFCVSLDTFTAILTAVDAHVEQVIGPDEDYRKLKPCKLCGAAYQYRCSCGVAVNTRLTEQRQRAGLEANHGA